MSYSLLIFADGRVYELEDGTAIKMTETQGDAQRLQDVLAFSPATTFQIAEADTPVPEIRETATRAARQRINSEGLNLIKSFEGLAEKVFQKGSLIELKAYDDGVGVWTIGYGHTKGVFRGMRIAVAKADDFLREDLANFEEAVSRAVKIALNEHQFAALVSFAFNVGARAFFQSTLLKKLNQGDIQGAANEFPRWNKAGGQALAGLTRRRKAEQALFLSQSWQDQAQQTEITVRLLQLTSPSMKGEDVKQLQQALLKSGLSVGESGADGVFGQATDQAVRTFQGQKGLNVDGKVGSATRQALGL